MWLRKIIYILLVVITSYIALMYEGPVPGVILALELLIFIIMFASSFYLKKSLKITAESKSTAVECGENAQVQIKFINTGLLPITDILLRAQISNCLDGEKESYDINMRVPAKDTVTVPFRFKSTYCGVIKTEFTNVVISDYFRLFTRKKKLKLKNECIVMPKLLDLQVAVSENCRNYDSDSEEYDKNRPGDDPGEIYQIREFRQGDRMSKVHWKMSARLDELMIKDMSRPISDSVGIYLDLRYDNIDEIQSVYDLCYSLSAALLYNDCHHRIIWYREGENPGFEEHLIANGDDLTETISRLLVNAKRTQKLHWDDYKHAKPEMIYRMIAVSCKDPSSDMDNFMDSDGTKKSVLTIDQLHELIEI